MLANVSPRSKTYTQGNMQCKEWLSVELKTACGTEILGSAGAEHAKHQNSSKHDFNPAHAFINKNAIAALKIQAPLPRVPAQFPLRFMCGMEQ